MSITIEHNKKERKRKSSILDIYHDEIKSLYDIELNNVAISKIINAKLPKDINLTVTSYRHFIKTRLEQN
ncbi:MAG: hypothetical protein U9N49_08825 [Campylobacterota bacterium]|nr:hypothetical protein [Campylobacterota bacterium]